ncbi:hypothetical protein VIRA109638_05370 [Vibrio rarus]
MGLCVNIEERSLMVVQVVFIAWLILILVPDFDDGNVLANFWQHKMCAHIYLTGSPERAKINY